MNACIAARGGRTCSVLRAAALYPPWSFQEKPALKASATDYQGRRPGRARSNECAAANCFDDKLGLDCLGRPYSAHLNLHPMWRYGLVDGDDWDEKFDEELQREKRQRLADAAAGVGWGAGTGTGTSFAAQRE